MSYLGKARSPRHPTQPAPDLQLSCREDAWTAQILL